MEKQITFKTKAFGHKVECYCKGKIGNYASYDVYLCKKCIIVGASLIEIYHLRKLLS